MPEIAQPDGRIFPLRDIKLMVVNDQVEAKFQMMSFSAAKTPLGTQYLVVNNIDGHTPLPNGVALFSREQLDDYTQRGILREVSYETAARELEACVSQGEFIANSSLTRDQAAQLIRDLQQIEAFGNLRIPPEFIVPMTPIITEETTTMAAKLDPKTTIEQSTQVLQKLITQAQEQGHEQEVAQALMSCISNINNSLPADSTLVEETRNFLNCVKAGGDPTAILERIAKKAPGGLLGGNWGLNMQTILALVGFVGVAGQAYKLVANRVDWVALASALNAKQQQAVEEDDQTRVSGDAEGPTISLSEG
jgi:hypothetical protein